MKRHIVVGAVGAIVPVVVLALAIAGIVPFAFGGVVAIVAIAVAVGVGIWLDDRTPETDHFHVETELSCAERGVTLEDAGR